MNDEPQRVTARRAPRDPPLRARGHRPPGATNPGTSRPSQQAGEAADHDREQPDEDDERSLGGELLEQFLLLGERSRDQLAADVEQLEDARVGGAVEDARSLAARFDEADPSQRREVL